MQGGGEAEQSSSSSTDVSSASRQHRLMSMIQTRQKSGMNLRKHEEMIR